MGDREQNLLAAMVHINQHCGLITNKSSLYETAAWGNTEQPAFLNQALEVETVLTALQLIRRILKVEKLMGRIRKEKYGPRLIDIDILLYADEIYNYKLLKLPHPEMQNRRFALLPLTEIAPDFVHPVFQKSISKLLEQCKDQLAVKKYS